VPTGSSRSASPTRTSGGSSPRSSGSTPTTRAELTVEIEKALAGDGRETWLARFAAAGIPAGSIRSIDEVYGWDQTRSQGLVVEVDHPSLGPIELPGPALRFDGAPSRRHTAPPLLGQHTDSVLEWLASPGGDDPAGTP
jgi:crotonobetainyl-CoA:carnitine CoA-transferase CaiB-like acyl-CoA transferase